MEKLKRKMKSVPWNFWALLLIVAFGIFLRTYEFHDWLRFSMDQSRDAQIISDAIEGKKSLPLLGPLAGGTLFHLGPAYYHFSFISAKIFGNYPDKMAYPSLFFSILAIPLLFFFLNEYFKTKISLPLTFIMSVSYFAVVNSRFSSNPNLSPFFVLLFLWSFLKILNSPNKIFWRWPILVGLSLGIGIQIHTTLLVILPVFTFVMFLYFIKRKDIPSLKIIPVVLLFALFVNVPQIISEARTQGGNAKQFIQGLVLKGGDKGELGENVATALICQIKSNAYILSPLPTTQECSSRIDLNLKKGSKEFYGEIKDRKLRKVAYISNIILISFLSLFGYFLLGYYFHKEKEKNKKNFLALLAVFNLVSLIFLIPIISSISISYFIILFFIPFVLLGLIFKFIQEKFYLQGTRVVLISVAILIILSLWAEKKEAESYHQGLNNNTENSDLREIEAIASFIIENSSSAEKVYFSGKKTYLKRFSRPLEYIIGRSNIKLIPTNINDMDEVDFGEEFFYIQKTGEEGLERNKIIRGYQVDRVQRFYGIEINILKKLKEN